MNLTMATKFMNLIIVIKCNGCKILLFRASQTRKNSFLQHYLKLYRYKYRYLAAVIFPDTWYYWLAMHLIRLKCPLPTYKFNFLEVEFLIGKKISFQLKFQLKLKFNFRIFITPNKFAIPTSIVEFQLKSWIHRLAMDTLAFDSNDNYT